MSLRSRWVPALRVARREALRARGRSLLVVVMIALPVLGVTAADVVLQTSEVTGVEGADRRMGASDALLTVEPSGRPVAQTADPELSGSMTVGPRQGRADLDDVGAALDREVEVVPIGTGGGLVRTDAGLADSQLVELDLADPLTEGLYRVDEGRVPRAEGEVVVNSDLAERGFGVGDELAVADGPTVTVVGVGDNAAYRGFPVVVGPPGTFGLQESEVAWLLDAGGPVTWPDVRRLNEVGVTVVSRAVLADPPADSELDPRVQGMFDGAGLTEDEVAVLALVVVMALLEVVLLAGPAFAVIARRQQRSLALMAATGATPPQARRVVLGSGLVLGVIGAVSGVLLGLLVAWLSLPVVQRFSDSFLGPYDVPWPHLAGIAGLGLLSALLAAIVPAWLASRLDVVAVLAGRRGDRKPSLRSPVIGVLVLGAGVGGAVWGAVGGGPFLIAVSAVVCILGMVLLVPLVVVGVARLARRMPLALRFAVRDAARHRTRTVPAVAAVAATVAGVVALGIAVSSDEARNQATYTPQLREGQAVVTGYPEEGWDAYQAVAEQYLPGATVTPMRGVAEQDGRRWTEVQLQVGDVRRPLSVYAGSYGTALPVSEDGRLPATVLGLSAEERERAERVLAAGGVVVFTDRDGVGGDEATVVTRDHRGREVTDTRRETLPAAVVAVSALRATAIGVLSAEAAGAVGVEPATVGLLVSGAQVSERQEDDVNEGLAALSLDVSFYVERGFQPDPYNVITQLVLAALGAVLMLGGTLTATFLSLSDARPDLATLAAVGASPRTRRGVAASYALVVGVVGALLGVLVGLVPGIAVTYPLTSGDWVQDIDPSLPDHFIDVPWLLVGGVVVVLPLLTAAVVGLSTRSRLPVVARID